MNSAEKATTPLNSILELIGDKLYQLRIQKGYTNHADFARDFGLPRIQYWRMEKGKANLTLKSLSRILEIHGITLGQFFENIASESQQKVEQ